jgi:hypothetical protein
MVAKSHEYSTPPPEACPVANGKHTRQNMWALIETFSRNELDLP